MDISKIRSRSGEEDESGQRVARSSRARTSRLRNPSPSRSSDANIDLMESADACERGARLTVAAAGLFSVTKPTCRKNSRNARVRTAVLGYSTPITKYPYDLYSANVSPPDSREKRRATVESTSPRRDARRQSTRAPRPHANRSPRSRGRDADHAGMAHVLAVPVHREGVLRAHGRRRVPRAPPRRRTEDGMLGLRGRARRQRRPALESRLLRATVKPPRDHRGVSREGAQSYHEHTTYTPSECRRFVRVVPCMGAENMDFTFNEWVRDDVDGVGGVRVRVDRARRGEGRVDRTDIRALHMQHEQGEVVGEGRVAAREALRADGVSTYRIRRL